MIKEIYKKISSLQNPIIKDLIKLRDNKSYREIQHKVVVIGSTCVGQIAQTITPLMLITADPSFFTGHDYLTKHPSTFYYQVSSEILKKISGMPSFDELIAVFPLPPPSTLENKNFLLAFDEVKDPGNLGTLIRSALALNWEGMFLLPGCCDPFNDKTLRASKGGSLLLPFRYGTHEEFISFSAHMNAPVIIADLYGEDLAKSPPFEKAILLLSNETHGVKPNIKSLGRKMTIPLSPHMESLNVAAAGAILMYALKKS